MWRVEEGNAYALLAAMAREHWAMEELPPLVRQPGGKPTLNLPGYEFSISHSGALALCALSERPVGADLELVRPRRAGLPRYALSEGEFAWFEGRGSRWEDFYTLWTLKEARVKCTGEGLRRAAREISVPLLVPGESRVWEGFAFTALEGEGWRGALCEMTE